MPRTDEDFNTEVADIFARLGRGERSPDRLSREELEAALETVERQRLTESTDKPSG